VSVLFLGELLFITSKMILYGKGKYYTLILKQHYILLTVLLASK